MVAIDASIALAIWFPDVPCSVDKAKERVEYLLHDLASRNERILIPTPALSEILVRAGKAGAEFVNRLGKSSRFEIAPFDALAAVEVALAIAAAKKSGGKRVRGSTDTWAKVKFDHQIVAICKVKQITVLYSDDPALCNFADCSDIRTVGLADLPLPPDEPTLFDGLDDIPPISESEEDNSPKRLSAGSAPEED
jgi:predicted nucleic acid-binding protein